MKYIDKTGAEPVDLTDWRAKYDARLQQLYINPKANGEAVWDFLDKHPKIDKVRKYYKKDLKNLLVREQHYLCCYCGKQIKNEPLYTVIEHLNPKDANKHLTYIYANLLASCDGGKNKKIHLLKKGETLAKIAEMYGADETALVEYVVIDADINKNEFRELVRVDGLKVGDTVIVIPKLDDALKHCENKKHYHSIPLQPTAPNIETHFKYLPDGTIDTTVSKAVEDTVNILGLNLPPRLVAERKGLVAAANNLKGRLLAAVGATHFRAEINRLCSQYYTPDPVTGMLEPYVFVTVSVLSQ